MENKPSILIIDDSKETVDGLESFFSEKYEVSTAHNGLDGIKEFDKSEAAWILSSRTWGCLR